METAPFEYDSTDIEDIAEFVPNFRMYLADNYDPQFSVEFIEQVTDYLANFQEGGIPDFHVLVRIARQYEPGIVDRANDREPDYIGLMSDDEYNSGDTDDYSPTMVIHPDDTIIEPCTDLVLTFPFGITTDNLVRRTRMLLEEEGDDDDILTFREEFKALLKDTYWSNQTLVDICRSYVTLQVVVPLP